MVDDTGIYFRHKLENHINQRVNNELIHTPNRFEATKISLYIDKTQCISSHGKTETQITSNQKQLLEKFWESQFTEMQTQRYIANVTNAFA